MKTSKSFTRKQLAELEAIAALPDDAIDTSDAPEVLDWSGAERGLFYRPYKKQITLRLDADLLGWFKSHTKSAKGYQTRINHALREYVRMQEKRSMEQGGTATQPPGYKAAAAEWLQSVTNFAQSFENADVTTLMKTVHEVMESQKSIVSKQLLALTCRHLEETERLVSESTSEISNEIREAVAMQFADTMKNLDEQLVATLTALQSRKAQKEYSEQE
jgi:uncharacterized protein (DUF4415 family)